MTTNAAKLHISADWCILLFIALPIVLFNLVAVFGLKALMVDDANRYFLAISNKFPFSFWEKGLFLCSFSEWIAWKTLVISPQLIRGLYVLVLMVPLSWVMFRLFRRIGLPKVVAYGAAVLPNILPGQTHVPAFINGSYFLLGLLGVAGVFWQGFEYLDGESRKSWINLCFALLFLMAATQLMDHTVFFLPALMVGFLIYQKRSRKHLFLLLSMLPIVLFKLVWIIQAPRDAAVAKHVSASEIISRVKFYFFSMLPLPGSIKQHEFVVILLTMLIVSLGLLFLFKDREQEKGFQTGGIDSKKQASGFDMLIFLFVWAMANMLPFLTMARGMSARQGYLACYGFIGAVLLFLHSIFRRVFHRWSAVFTGFIVVTVMVSGFSRYYDVKAYFQPYNETMYKIEREFKAIQWPEKSQIVIILRQSPFLTGFWHNSSGHLKYILNRKDVDGLIGLKNKYERNFYDPFDPKQRKYGSEDVMSGLSLKRPVFLFGEREGVEGFRQFEYALRWRGTYPVGSWTLFKLDPRSGRAKPLVRGEGRGDYDLALHELGQSGILPQDILWGGEPLR